MNIENIILFQIDKTSKVSKLYSQREFDRLGMGITVEQWILLKFIEENDGLICEPLNEELEWRVFNFECTKNFGSYIFQFWQGQDSNGNDTYLTYEVPVE